MPHMWGHLWKPVWGITLTMLLPQPPKGWNYRYIPQPGPRRAQTMKKRSFSKGPIVTIYPFICPPQDVLSFFIEKVFWRNYLLWWQTLGTQASGFLISLTTAELCMLCASAHCTQLQSFRTERGLAQDGTMKMHQLLAPHWLPVPLVCWWKGLIWVLSAWFWDKQLKT